MYAKLYESPNFTVVHSVLDRPTKIAQREHVAVIELYKRDASGMHAAVLVDELADEFYAQVHAWQLDTPLQEAVEATLEHYFALAPETFIITQ